jgi:hypothetical protein
VQSVYVGNTSTLNLIIRSPGLSSVYRLPELPLYTAFSTFSRTKRILSCAGESVNGSLVIRRYYRSSENHFFVFSLLQLSIPKDYGIFGGSGALRQRWIGSHRLDQLYEYVNVDEFLPGTVPKWFPQPVRKTRLTAHNNNIIYYNIKVYINVCSTKEFFISSSLRLPKSITNKRVARRHLAKYHFTQ